MFSLGAIVGPPLMTQLFSRFSAPTAPIQLPGAAFFAASALTLACFVLYWRATRNLEPVAPARSDAA